jgi:hypothetical protein
MERKGGKKATNAIKLQIEEESVIYQEVIPF